VHAKEPYPDSGATDVDPDVVLGWKAGRDAVSHDVYVNADPNALTLAGPAAGPATEPAFDTASLDLELGQIYHWRVDEVNDAETTTTWQGDVWSFTTQEYLVVDDFESYNDIDDLTDPESHRIFESWPDGYEISTNGALIGNDDFPYAEQGTVHGGRQSMPMVYSNVGLATFSEATRTFADPQDWTAHGVTTLVLWFHGTPGNTGQLYVRINGVRVAYPGDVADIQTFRWKQWNIDLASSGVNVQTVTTLAIGVDGVGTGGTLYFDDIVLYRLAPEIVVPSEEYWIEAEATTSITMPMEVRDDPTASGGKYITTDESVGNSSNNPPADGIATYNFTVAGGTYKLSCRLKIPDTSNSFWIRIQGATTPAETELHSSGWVRWNDMPGGGEWSWADVFSDDDPEDDTVLFTLNPGAHTLEIARREDGAQLDVIVISSID